MFEPNTQVVDVSTHLAFARPLTSDNAAARLILGRGMVAVSQLSRPEGVRGAMSAIRKTRVTIRRELT
jgi:hypothetical protein